MTLPASEIERIEATADALFNPKDLPICTQEIAYSLGLQCSAYIAGAQAEAVRGREQMVAFAEWLGENYDTYDKGIYWSRSDIDNEPHTTAELLDLFLDTQKQKG